jgi:hypothetical protein
LPQRPIKIAQALLLAHATSAFGGTADMAGLAAALVPVENDLYT